MRLTELKPVYSLEATYLREYELRSKPGGWGAAAGHVEVRGDILQESVG